MKIRFIKSVPLLIAGGVMGFVCLVHTLPLFNFTREFDLFQRLEWISYDWRVRQAARHSPSISTNLGFASISDNSISTLIDGSLGFQCGLYWPRHVYGRLVRELAAEGAKVVGFDVMFGELRPDHARIAMPDQILIGSDEFFVQQVRLASNVVLAATKEIVPPEMFFTNAWAIGDISTEKDSDGILRRAKAFVDYRVWHPEIKQLARAVDFDLSSPRFEGKRIVFRQKGGGEFEIPLNKNGTANLAEVTGEPGKGNLKPFLYERVWRMGIILAARELNADLAKAEVDLPHHRIILRGDRGVERIIPVDEEGRFYIDWSLTISKEQLAAESRPAFEHEPVETLLARDVLRTQSKTEGLTNRFKGKLVVVGSIATGNDLTDVGATPLEKETFLVSKHLNVANAVITGRFIHRSSYLTELLLIILLGSISALLTWRLRALWASFSVISLTVLYVGLGVILFVQFRYWLPLVLPVGGALLMTHACLVAYRAVVEQNERRRIKSVFSRIVSPEVVNELLRAESIQVSGVRRLVTVFFADVRGFTEFTDVSQVGAEEYARQQNLTGKDAEEYFDAQASGALDTVNLYLSVVADIVIRNNGTLDKYIGDCVMAFWGAPTVNDHHALNAVKTAVEAQRAIYDLNQKRFADNERRKQENQELASTNQPPLPMQPLLNLGSGINTGKVTVGLMGSDAHIVNYTVFGREVNVASRLEGVSGGGRVIIGQATYAELLRDDPALAAMCVEHPPVTVKGIRGTVKIYEVPWKTEAAKTGISPEAVPSAPQTVKS